MSFIYLLMMNATILSQILFARAVGDPVENKNKAMKLSLLFNESDSAKQRANQARDANAETRPIVRFSDTDDTDVELDSELDRTESDKQKAAAKKATKALQVWVTRPLEPEKTKFFPED